jgi:hypothetical protein
VMRVECACVHVCTDLLFVRMRVCWVCSCGAVYVQVVMAAKAGPAVTVGTEERAGTVRTAAVQATAPNCSSPQPNPHCLYVFARN